MKLSKFFLKQDMYFLNKIGFKKNLSMKMNFFVNSFRIVLLIYSFNFIFPKSSISDNIKFFSNSIIFNKHYLVFFLRQQIKTIYIN
jgi:hypothetical protein